MSAFSHLIDEEESEAVQEARAVAQAQFIDLSERYVRQAQELNRYKAAYRSASARAGELSRLLVEELTA